MEAKISLDVPILYDYSWGYDHSLELNSTMVIDVLAKLSGILLKELKIHRDTDDHGNISCSFKWWNHPECDDLKKSLKEWMYKHYRELTGTHDSSVLEYEKLLKGDIDVLTRMAYAHGKRERMLAIAKFIAWICVFDNCMDEPANMGDDVDASRAMVRSLMGIFDMEHDAHQECEHFHHINDTKNARKIVTTIMESAREWWEDMKELGMSITQQRRFVLVLTDYFNASIQQVELHDQRKIPHLLEYTSLRLRTSVCFPLLVLVEFSLGLDLSLDTLHHPLVCALQRAVNCHAMFVNDIYSFTKELFDGDLMNLILFSFGNT